MRVDTPIRNVSLLPDGRIDCELLHPVYGWIPFTASPNDPEIHGIAIYKKLVSEYKNELQ